MLEKAKQPSGARRAEPAVDVFIPLIRILPLDLSRLKSKRSARMLGRLPMRQSRAASMRARKNPFAMSEPACSIDIVR